MPRRARTAPSTSAATSDADPEPSMTNPVRSVVRGDLAEALADPQVELRFLGFEPVGAHTGKLRLFARPDDALRPRAEDPREQTGRAICRRPRDRRPGVPPRSAVRARRPGRRASSLRTGRLRRGGRRRAPVRSGHSDAHSARRASGTARPSARACPTTGRGADPEFVRRSGSRPAPCSARRRSPWRGALTGWTSRRLRRLRSRQAGLEYPRPER